MSADVEDDRKNDSLARVGSRGTERRRASSDDNTAASRARAKDVIKASNKKGSKRFDAAYDDGVENEGGKVNKNMLVIGSPGSGGSGGSAVRCLQGSLLSR